MKKETVTNMFSCFKGCAKKFITNPAKDKVSKTDGKMKTPNIIARMDKKRKELQKDYLQ